MNYSTDQPQAAGNAGQPSPRSSDFVSYPNISDQQQSSTPVHQGFGAPVMGEPANPNSHPDNRQAASQPAHGAPEYESILRANEQQTGSVAPPSGLGRQPSSPYSKVGGNGAGLGGLRRQASGAYDATNGSKADKGFSGPGVSAAGAGAASNQQTASQPTSNLGQQPGSPYVQTAEDSGKSPKDHIVESLTNCMHTAGNVWGHLRAGPSMTDSAWGRMTYATRLLTEGGFEGVYRQTFGLAPSEQLLKTYACYLSTSTGPVAGTLYITNEKFAFCSDLPLSYAAAPGKQAFSYYKVVVPLEKVREVIPSVNQSKPAEKYIQVITQDNHEFWFMGFVNYDKGLKNMQETFRQATQSGGQRGRPPVQHE